MKKIVLLLGVVMVLVILANRYRSDRMRQSQPVEEAVAPGESSVPSALSQPDERRQPHEGSSDSQEPERTAEELAEVEELHDKLQKQAAYLAGLKDGPPDDPELEKDAEEFMLAEVGDLLNSIPFYGLDSIPSSSVAKGRFRMDGSRVYVLETPDLSTFVAEGTVVQHDHFEGRYKVRSSGRAT